MPKKFEDCKLNNGMKIGDDQAKCETSCLAMDLWINGIDDIPLTIAGCGFESEKTQDNETQYSVFCEKKQIEDYKGTVKHFVDRYYDETLNDDDSIDRDDCLNLVMSIDAVTYRTCSEHDNCNELWNYPRIKVVPGSEECDKLIGQRNETGNANTGKPPEQSETAKSNTGIPPKQSDTAKPNTESSSEQNEANPSGSPSEKTTSGGGRIVNSMDIITKLSFVFLMIFPLQY